MQHVSAMVGGRWLKLRVLPLGLAILGAFCLAQFRDGRAALGQRGDGVYGPAHRKLLAALASSGRLTARLAGELSYVPPPLGRTNGAVSAAAAQRSGNRAVGAWPVPPIPIELQKSIVRAAQRDPAADNLATLAVLNLLMRRWDPAIAGFRAALVRRPNDANLLNDLAAAHLERAVAPPETESVSAGGGDPAGSGSADLIEALDILERSLDAQPTLPGLFNTAATLEILGLRSEAVASWQRYLASDPRSRWSAAARAHLAALSRNDSLRSSAVVVAGGGCFADHLAAIALGAPPWVARQAGERRLLACWADRFLRGDEAGAETALRQAAALLATLHPDAGRMLADSLNVIRDAQRAADRARLATLAAGHRDFAGAWQLKRSEHASEAHVLAERSARALRDGGSPFALSALLLSAATVPVADWAAITLVEQRAGQGGYWALQAEAQQEAAYYMTLEGRFEPAVPIYQQARQTFLRLGETEPAAVLAVMAAEIEIDIGAGAPAMHHLGDALVAAPGAVDPWNRYSIYTVAAVALKHSFSLASMHLHREAAAVCAEIPERPLCAADSWLRISQLMPDAAAAADVLRKETARVAALPASDGRSRTLVDLDVAVAQTLAGPRRQAADRERAATIYAHAAQAYATLGQHPAAARARALEAQVLQQLALPERSAAEYRLALQELRSWDRHERFQSASADQVIPPEVRQVYQSLLDLELRSRDGVSRPALLLAEEMHSQLAPRRNGAPRLPGDSDLDGCLAALPPGLALVEYSVGGERPVAWVLAARRLEQVALVLRPALGDRIARLARVRSPDEWRRRTDELFRELIAPVFSRLPEGVDRVAVVPDGALYGLPFRALWNAAAQRYLDDSYEIQLAPSLDLVAPSDQAPVPNAATVPSAMVGTASRAGAVPQVGGAPLGGEAAMDAISPVPDVAPQKGAPPRSGTTPRNGATSMAVLSLGVSRFSAAIGLAPLPAAVREAAQVRMQYPAAGSCTATDWQSFCRCAPLAQVIHLATHASAGPTPARTWLAFAAETVALDRLWQELPPLPAHPLVVLSSCRSVATPDGAEGLGGLARPFLASGARAVVGTLWQIDDDEAAVQFEALHRAFRRTGDLGLALQEARRSLPHWRERPWAWAGLQTVCSLRFLMASRQIKGKG